MFRREGMTLLEILVVLVIVGLAAAMFFPNYTTPTEQARAANVRNNLLAIYSAEQNYRNNNGSYCISTTNPNPCDTLSHINFALSLNIQDDGTYTYSCAGVTCTATRTNTSNLGISVTLNLPIQLNGNNPNPICTLTTGCP